jgi:valyl-tRNA synthetase
LTFQIYNLDWIIAENETQALDMAKKKFQNNFLAIEQDSDVLDTWFSSALLPFSALEQKQVQKFHGSSSKLEFQS